MNSKPRVRSDLLHFMRNVTPFFKKSFEAVIAQNLSDVKSFLKYFSESPETQTEENVKAFFKIFFFGAELRNKVTNLKAELDASEYRTFVYPRTIKGASTAEFIKTKREYDKLRAEVEEMGRISIHIQSIDQNKAVKMVKSKITDLDKMKMEEQKKAFRNGYDIDIMPSDINTFGKEAKSLLNDLQSRNERLFMATILIMNTADTKRKLDNIIFQEQGITQKYHRTQRITEMLYHMNLITFEEFEKITKQNRCAFSPVLVELLPKPTKESTLTTVV